MSGQPHTLAGAIEAVLTRLPVRDCEKPGGELDTLRVREASREVAATVERWLGGSCPAPDLPEGCRCDGCDCERAGQ